MSRAILCFVVIGIFLNLSQTTQADTSTEATTKGDDVTPAPVKEEANKSGKDETPVKQEKADSEDVTKTDDLKTAKAAGAATKSPLTPQVDFKSFGDGNFLAPVKSARGKIGEVISKTMDSAKGVADGAYNMVKGAVSTLL